MGILIDVDLMWVGGVWNGMTRDKFDWLRVLLSIWRHSELKLLFLGVFHEVGSEFFEQEHKIHAFAQDTCRSTPICYT